MVYWFRLLYIYYYYTYNIPTLASSQQNYSFVCRFNSCKIKKPQIENANTYGSKKRIVITSHNCVCKNVQNQYMAQLDDSLKTTVKMC